MTKNLKVDLRTLMRAALVMLLAIPVLIGLAPAPAGAATSCPKPSTWQTLGGSRVHAKITFRPGDLCNGKHVKRAYVKLFRTCWPKMSTGWVGTSTASSRTSMTTYSVTKTVTDSPNWGCNTQWGWNWDYF